MPLRKILGLALILCLLAIAMGTPQGIAQDAKSKSFKAVVEDHFDAWDANKDGKVDAQEIDKLLHRRSVKGEEAAAVASIHVWMRNHKSNQGLTKSVLTSTKDGTEERRDMAQKSPHFSSDYRSLVHHLNTVPRKPFTDKRPQLEDLSQGHLGDCYFVSMVGALVHRNAEGLHRVIRVGSSGDCELDFPDGKRAHVPELTDGLICLGSTAHQSGLWLNILEEGFGEVRRTKKPGTPGDPAIDKIGHGGSQTTTITLLTGKHAFYHSLKSLPPGKVHQLLMEAQARHLLMGAGTPSKGKKMPKGVASDHAYAILGVQGDKIQVWNPWGNHFSPKGEPGMDNGFPTEKGVFTVTVQQFCEIFSDLSIETAEAASAGKHRKK